MQSDPAEDAWTFALRAYGRPGAQAAFLALEERRGIDVVALLALLYGVALGRALPAEDTLRAALLAVAPWRREAVLGLRAVRRALKGWSFDPGGKADPGAERARQAVALAEQAAERVELERLVEALAGGAAPGRPGTARDGARALALYAAAAGTRFAPEDRADLAAILSASLPDSAPESMTAVDAVLYR